MRTMIIALLALGATGCGPRIFSIASHTIRSGPDKDTDVVWITIDGKLNRCHGGERPSCVRVD